VNRVRERARCELDSMDPNREAVVRQESSRGDQKIIQATGKVDTPEQLQVEHTFVNDNQ
jgi:hypothetical protein